MTEENNLKSSDEIKDIQKNDRDSTKLPIKNEKNAIQDNANLYK